MLRYRHPIIAGESISRTECFDKRDPYRHAFGARYRNETTVKSFSQRKLQQHYECRVGRVALAGGESICIFLNTGRVGTRVDVWNYQYSSSEEHIRSYTLVPYRYNIYIYVV